MNTGTYSNIELDENQLKAIDELVAKIHLDSKIAILSGAGVSAESGIATFRDPDGLWAKFNPQELASIDGFMENPDLVWQWYQYRVNIVKNAKANPGHLAIADLQKIIKNFTLITQNVDRLHQRAGSENVIELHGNIVSNHCFSCKKNHILELEENSKSIAKCTYCGGNIRPSVVWFGEMLPEKEIDLAYKKSEEADIFLSIGTSAEVYPAANLPYVAMQNGAYVVEINPNNTIISNRMHNKIKLASAIALPIIVQKIKTKFSID